MVLIVLYLVLVTNDVRQHHFHKQKIYLLRVFSIDPASISVKRGLFSSKQQRPTRRNNSLHPCYMYLTSHGHENQSQHYPDHRYLYLELSGRIPTPDGFSYHTAGRGLCNVHTWSMTILTIFVQHYTILSTRNYDKLMNSSIRSWAAQGPCFGIKYRSLSGASDD